jgi:outer membrane protein OmpA-like peptidoglycan-associated protein
MFSNNLPSRHKSEEGERPFWISYADLMTALMILFLVVMVASIVSLTDVIKNQAEGEKQRSKDIAELCRKLKLKAEGSDQRIKVDCNDNRINFGEAGRFGHDDFRLGNEGRNALRNVVPLILDAAESEEGKSWFKQVLIEGFTDTDGSYLYNLHLSLQRSEFVMCTLLDVRATSQIELTETQKAQVRNLFLAGGVSFNNAKESKEASRRVELRMQFYGVKDKKDQGSQPVFNITKTEICKLS